MGKSFSVSCSCKLMVWVEMTAFFFCAREQNCRNQIGNAFADACAGLDREVLPVLQRPCHRHGHFLLLRAKFKILRLRQNSRRRKNLFDLRNEVSAGGLMFDDGNHLFSKSYKGSGFHPNKSNHFKD